MTRQTREWGWDRLGGLTFTKTVDGFVTRFVFIPASKVYAGLFLLLLLTILLAILV